MTMQFDRLWMLVVGHRRCDTVGAPGARGSILGDCRGSCPHHGCRQGRNRGIQVSRNPKHSTLDPVVQKRTLQTNKRTASLSMLRSVQDLVLNRPINPKFRTYPANYKPPDAAASEYQTIPLDKIEDFGVHANQYYQLDVSFFKVDTPLPCESVLPARRLILHGRDPHPHPKSSIVRRRLNSFLCTLPSSLGWTATFWLCCGTSTGSAHSLRLLLSQTGTTL